jgi:transcriptional regulator with XRE-family HTH domain
MAKRGISKSLHSDEQRAFCALMIETRKKTGMTQAQLANKLRKPQSFVAKYEGGERRIDVTEFLGIVHAMGADPVALIRALTRRIS